MKCERSHSLRCVVIGATLGFLCAVVAASPLGPYVGAALGQAAVRSDEAVFASPLHSFDEHHSAWKVMAGIRPITLLGAEIEYLNFGHPSVTSNAFTADVQQKATAVFGIVGLPIPLPVIDIYGKAGVARLQSMVNVQSVLSQFHHDHADTNFAYGAGVQVKLLALGVRAEYERISASGGQPDLLSLGVTLNF
jgi:hypothetical protein